MSATQAWQRTVGSLTESGQAIAGASGATLVISAASPGAQSSPHGSAISTLTISAGGHSTLTYAASGLPAGLSISSSTGAITGTPTTAGLYSPVVTVSDASTGVADSVQFDWSIT